MENGSNGVQGANNQEAKPVGDGDKEQFVQRSAYEEVSRDMHRYKSTNKELAAKLTELETRIKTSEETKMQEEKRFEELYQKERAEREKAEQALKNTNDHYLKSVKMTALMRELGRSIKTKYLQHAALDEIIVREDGTLSSESVTAVANKFRQENPELVPSQNAGNITDVAPGAGTLNASEKKSLDNMTQDEKRALLASKRTPSHRVGIKS